MKKSLQYLYEFDHHFFGRAGRSVHLQPPKHPQLLKCLFNRLNPRHRRRLALFAAAHSPGRVVPFLRTWTWPGQLPIRISGSWLTSLNRC